MAGVRVSDRDLALMIDLYDSGFLSFYQIHEEYFAKRAKPTVYNRLSRLAKSGLIQALTVNLVAHHRSREDIGVVYQLTKAGLNVLKSFCLGRVFLREPLSINMSALYHDLVLTDVLRVIKKGQKEYEVLNGKHWQSARKEVTKVPDALLQSINTSEYTAIELELTAKSEKRYQDIVLGYRMNQEMKKVLYVVANNQIREKIGKVITGFGENFSLTDDTGAFYFVELRDLLRTGGLLSCSNGKDELFHSNPSTNFHREVI